MVSQLQKPLHEMDRLWSYLPGSAKRQQLLAEIQERRSMTEEIPLIINGREVRTDNTIEVRSPHDHQRVLARACLAGERELEQAVEGALRAWKDWSAADPYHRAAVFQRAAELLSGSQRIENIAAIMMNHSKTPYEAELDLAELVDFWRFNCFYLQFLYDQQPDSAPGEVNRLDWRPLEGFVLAIPPFNFYAIGGNLPTAPALAGNVSLWKPATTVLLSNYSIMKVLMEAGLPDGVIQFVPHAHEQGGGLLSHPDLAGLHFTGSYDTLVHLWKEVSGHVEHYRNFPRIVGETGGKDFIFVHPSADIDAVVANAIRGAFEYQGQKCSAASRMYVPSSLWKPLAEILRTELEKMKMGPTEDLEVHLGALIEEKAFRKVVSYLEHAKSTPDEYEIVGGGKADDSRGWFVEPTVVLAKNPRGRLMTEEIFGPVLTVYVYPDEKFEDALELCDNSTPYALTGAIFARDRGAIRRAEARLRYAAGNFYINDKPTGAVVNRQPFGGARRSGTNDKAGFWVNITRWLSPRAIKETAIPATDWHRPYQSLE